MYLNQMKENGDYGYKLGPNGTKYSGYETLNMAVDLIWEEARKQDLGIDLKLFNDDLSIIFDIFKERRENILLKRENSIPSFLDIIHLLLMEILVLLKIKVSMLQ